jgi:hypothetical protein
VIVGSSPGVANNTLICTSHSILQQEAHRVQAEMAPPDSRDVCDGGPPNLHNTECENLPMSASQQGGNVHAVISSPAEITNHWTLPDPLTFRPLVLRPWFLFLSLGFDIAVTTLLVVLCVYQRFNLLNDWAYFVVKIFPTIIGTITAAKLESIIAALSRITPFMRCAGPNGDMARTSILLPYVPRLSMSASAGSRNWHLFWGSFILWLGYNVLALKAALLSASLDDWTAEVNDWAAYALIAGYALITIYTGYVVYYLHNRPTGLRQGWDTVNIADHLVLFRQSNFLDAFEGSGIATRQSIKEHLGTRRLKLGYWPFNDPHTNLQGYAQDGRSAGTQISTDSASQDAAQNNRN